MDKQNHPTFPYRVLQAPKSFSPQMGKKKNSSPAFANLWLLLVIIIVVVFTFIILVFISIDVYSTFEKLCIETSLAGSKRTPPLAGKLQSPLCAGWQYVSFRILNYAGWLTPVLHDGWLGVLFSETLACWQ